MRYIVCLFLCLILASCKDANRKHAESIWEEWENKEILFPEHLVFSIQGKDTTNYSIKNREFKIVVYVDSVGCTSCKLHLPRWANLIQQVDSMTSHSVEFLFFFFPKEGRDIYHTLRMEKFDYPVCMDESDSFNKLNHFPSDVRFQTFLLNKENRVIAIGNPVHNPKIKELYLNIISGGTMARKEKQVQTEVTANETTVDLGEFGWNTSQETIFTLRNTGKSLLVIDDVVTSCGCTSVEYAKEPVRPGKSLDINVVYKADHPEHFNKTIMVYCNAATSPIQLKIQGNAK